MYRNAALIALSLVVLGAFGCTLGPRYQVKRLPSGKEIKVLSLTTMRFPSGPPALMLKYQTDLSIDNVAALQAEANDVMDVLKIDAEQANVTRAIISANDEPKGLIFKQGKSYNFLYEKGSDGRWVPYDDGKK